MTDPDHDKPPTGWYRFVGDGNPTRFDTGHDPHPSRVRVPAWVRGVWWTPPIAVLTGGLVAWGALGFLTTLTVVHGNHGARIALAAVWLGGMLIGRLLPPPPPLAIPPPQRARARGIREHQEDDA